MDEGGGVDATRRRAGFGIILLRLVSAVAVIFAGVALTNDLAEKDSRLPRTTPRPSEEPAEEPIDLDDDIHVAWTGDATIYDAQEDLDRCVRVRRTFAAASTEPGFDDDIDRITKRLERIRGLEFARSVDTRLVPRSEVGARFARGYRKQYTAAEAAQDERVLSALGLVPTDIDLRELGASLVSRGVAGFYNPWKKRLFAAATASGLTPYDEVVLAHELDHALVDQVIGLPGTISRDPMLVDVMLARQALAEGDATLAMSRYAEGRMPAGEFDAFLERFSRRTIQADPEIPYFVARSSEFPYYEGLLFACSAWLEGGWDYLDEIYLRPPPTTADLVFPERYGEAAEAILPPSPASPGGRWKPLLTRSLGVFDLMLLLENADVLSTGETVPGSHVREVIGWDGGVLRAWARGRSTAIHIGLVDGGLETGQGLRRKLCRVLQGWYTETFPGTAPAGHDVWARGGTFVGTRCRGRSVELAIAPSLEGVRRLLKG